MPKPELDDNPGQIWDALWRIKAKPVHQIDPSEAGEEAGGADQPQLLLHCISKSARDSKAIKDLRTCGPTLDEIVCVKSRVRVARDGASVDLEVESTLEQQLRNLRRHPIATSLYTVVGVSCGLAPSHWSCGVPKPQPFRDSAPSRSTHRLRKRFAQWCRTASRSSGSSYHPPSDTKLTRQSLRGVAQMLSLL